MVQVRYGGKNGVAYDLEVSEGMIAVRTHERQRSVVAAAPEDAAPLSARAREALRGYELMWTLPAAGVEVMRPYAAARSRDEVRFVLKEEPSVRFAGRVLRDASGAPVLYTENFFVKFDDDQDQERCAAILASYGLTVKKRITYARNAYFVEATEGTGLKVFDVASALLQEPEVVLCSPEIVRQVRARAAFPQQWHLQPAMVGGNAVNAHANVVDAWNVTRGEGVTIAVVDTGIDMDHEEFRSAGKLVAPRDVTAGDNDPRPVSSSERHGTACAGVACGDGNFGASGVAPRARLMPIRLMSGLGSQAEADAFEWAATHGADVISCSWGPEDGLGILQPLPDSTRTAIDFAVSTGRNGKGCVILFAAGNGNESVDLDRYASYPKVIAVAACNDTGMRSEYSDFGDAVWCTFPSNDFGNPLTPGIWTADVSGKRGYNPGLPNPEGDDAGNYTNSFGGTSSSCPGTAGVAALIIAANPELRWDEVKELFRSTSDKIDQPNGQYDAAGHSPKYGYGRVNARRAVDAARPTIVPNRVIRRIQPNAAIMDFNVTNAILNVADTTPVMNIKASVDVEHTWVGDLTLTLQPPNADPILLHARVASDSSDNLKRTYDVVSTPELQQLIGKAPVGAWTLSVSDQAAQDQGVLKEFAIELHFQQ